MRTLPDFPLRALGLAVAALALGGCSSTEGLLSGDKLDYRSQSAKTATLEVPPDLTQLARDSRYQPQSGSISASTMQQQAAAAPAALGTAAPAPVALKAAGDLRIERQGAQRWLVTAMTPEQLWPQLRGFWQERGFAIAIDSAEAGVMETDWAENRAKLPQDGVRRLIGGILESLYSTGERDKFRTRVERGPAGTEITITHRGMEEVLQGNLKDQSVWTRRPTDPDLEAEMLARLMVKLGAREDSARASVAATATATAAAGTAPQVAARARALGAGTLEVDEAFDRAWRRVGIALDRSGFTVEDRDRTNGLYYVRYVDPKSAGQEEPGLLARIFGGNKAQDTNLQRYRVALKPAGDKTQVAVQNSQGAVDQGDIGKRIVGLLLDELK